MRPTCLPLALLAISLALGLAGCSRQAGELPVKAAAPADAEIAVAADPLLSGAEASDHAAFYTVDHYDKSRDPAEDLKATIRRAEAEEKRILLQIGGDWCGWCARMSSYMETNETIRRLIDENFLVMKVTYPGGEYTEPFLAQYPKVRAYPHLFVLERDGTLLHSQGTGELEEGKSYNEDVFRDFLVSWIPADN